MEASGLQGAQLPVLLPQGSWRVQAPPPRCGSGPQRYAPAVAPVDRGRSLRIPTFAGCAPGQNTAKERRTPDGMVLAVLLISCLNLIGATAVAPATPALLQHFTLYSDACLGFMSSSFAVGRLCTTSIWPIASDHIGRRRTLCIAMIGGAISSFLQGAAISLNWSFRSFLLIRGIAGTFSGVAPVVKATIVDSFPPDQVPKVLAYREAASTFAFVVGPSIGGFLAAWHFSLPLYFAAGSGLLAAAIAANRIPSGKKLRGDQLAKRTHQKAQVPGAVSGAQRATEQQRGGTLRLLRSAVPLLVLSLVWASTRSCFHTYYPLMLARRYTLDFICVGGFMTAVSLLIVVVQIGLFEPAQRRLGLERTLAIGSVLIALGLMGIGEVPGGVLFSIFSGLYALGVGLLTPALPALLLQTVPRQRCGTLLGVESFLVNVGRVLAPPIYGLLPLNGASQVSGLCTLGASLIVLGFAGRRAAPAQPTQLQQEALDAAP